jgi:hypothetical protein
MNTTTYTNVTAEQIQIYERFMAETDPNEKSSLYWDYRESILAVERAVLRNQKKEETIQHIVAGTKPAVEWHLQRKFGK